MTQKDDQQPPAGAHIGIDISEEDIFDAMSRISGYVDISTEDFREVYRLAYGHAIERLVGTVKARDIMVREVVSVRGDTACDEVIRLMAAKTVKGVPVIDTDRKVIGMVSQFDFLRHFGCQSFMQFIARYLDRPDDLKHTLHELTAADVMSAPAVLFHEDSGFLEMMKTFKAHRVSRVPVVDGTGRALGMISRKDFIKSCTLEPL